MKQAPPNPERTVPASWPVYGTLRGKRVVLREIAGKLPPADLADVEVELPQGRSFPWRGQDYAIADDGSIVL